jgi:hypothetical protein
MEPSADVLATEIAHIRELIEHMERFQDERYRTSQAAIGKAEEAQRAYNAGHNDLARKLDNQVKEFVDRNAFYEAKEAADAKIEEVKVAIGRIRDGMKDDALSLARENAVMARENAKWTRGALLTCGVSLIGWGITVVLFLVRGAG